MLLLERLLTNANKPAQLLRSAESLQQLGLPLSTVSSALRGMQEKDVVEQAQNQYTIVNSALKWLLTRN